MTLFLRDKTNKTVVDIELYKKDGCIELSSYVDIIAYSKILLNTAANKQQATIEVFAFISELRGWLWENYFMGRKNTADEFDKVLFKVREFLDALGQVTDLHRVED